MILSVGDVHDNNYRPVGLRLVDVATSEHKNVGYKSLVDVLSKDYADNFDIRAEHRCVEYKLCVIDGMLGWRVCYIYPEVCACGIDIPCIIQSLPVISFSRALFNMDLINIEIINIDTSNAIELNYMFMSSKCRKPLKLKLRATKCDLMSRMFAGANITSLELEFVGKVRPVDCSYMFFQANVGQVRVSGIDFSRTKIVAGMFETISMRLCDARDLRPKAFFKGEHTGTGSLFANEIGIIVVNIGTYRDLIRGTNKWSVRELRFVDRRDLDELLIRVNAVGNTDKMLIVVR